MTSVTFDTLKYTKRLEEAGIGRREAEAQAIAYKEAMQEVCEGFVSKEEITSIRKDGDGYKTDIVSVKESIEKIKAEIDKIKAELGSMKTSIAVIMWMNGLTILTLVVPALKTLLNL